MITPSPKGEGVITTLDGDDVVLQYKREKEEIKKIYRGKDLVETTLRRLSSEKVSD